MDQKKVKDHFEQLAPNYDKKRVKYFNQRLNGEVLSQIDVPRGSRVLEVGVGTGSLFKELNDLYECCGVDISGRMIEIARTKTNSNKLRVVDGTELPYKDNFFDCVISLDVVEHVDDYRTFLKEINRVLKPGGQIILSTPNPLWAPVLWTADLLNMMADEGEHRFLWMKAIDREMGKTGYSGIQTIGPIFVPVAPQSWAGVLTKIEQKISGTFLKYFSFCQLIKARKVEVK